MPEVAAESLRLRGMVELVLSAEGCGRRPRRSAVPSRTSRSKKAAFKTIGSDSGSSAVPLSPWRRMRRQLEIVLARALDIGKLESR